MKKSKLYHFIMKILNDEDIETFEVGKTSKEVLQKIKNFLENNDEKGELKDKLLKTHKITINIAMRIILEKQAQIRMEKLLEEDNPQNNENKKDTP